MSTSVYDFLRACSMCNNQLGVDHDIFMYKGNKAFCSEECRQKQIEMDDHSEKKKNLRTLKRAAPPDLNIVYKK